MALNEGSEQMEVKGVGLGHQEVGPIFRDQHRFLLRHLSSLTTPMARWPSPGSGEAKGPAERGHMRYPEAQDDRWKRKLGDS